MATVPSVTDNVLEYLRTLGYEGELLNLETLEKEVKDGILSKEYVDIVCTICNEIKELYHLEEAVTIPSGPEDEQTFNLELKAFLRELGCGYSSLVTDREALKLPNNRMLLLSYILSEVMSARITKGKNSGKSTKSLIPKDPVGYNLSRLIQFYGLSVPPPSVSTKNVMLRLIAKTKERLGELPELERGKLLDGMVKQPLSEVQWADLDKINEKLTQEYAMRREMLLKRADVTVRSFTWSDKIKGKEDSFEQLLEEHKRNMPVTAPVDISRVLAARADLAVVEGPASDNKRSAVTNVSLNKILVGKVPDRGGRPGDIAQASMPSFKRREAPKEQRSGGFNKQAGGGQRVQGGWSGQGGQGKKGGGGGGHGKGKGGRGGRAPGRGGKGGGQWSRQTSWDPLQNKAQEDSGLYS